MEDEIKVFHQYPLHHPWITPSLWAGAYVPHFIRRFRQVWQYPLVGGRPFWLRVCPGRDPKLDVGWTKSADVVLTASCTTSAVRECIPPYSRGVRHIFTFSSIGLALWYVCGL